MQIALMSNILVFLDYFSQSTYLIKTAQPVDSIIIHTQHGFTRTLVQEIESHNNITSLMQALKIYGVSCGVTCLDGCSIVNINQ